VSRTRGGLDSSRWWCPVRTTRILAAGWHPRIDLAVNCQFLSKVRSVLCASVLLWIAGCASTNDAQSPVGVNYSRGSLTAVEAVEFRSAWRACLAALNHTGVTVLDQATTPTEGLLDGRTNDLKAVKVRLRRLSADKTEIRIRISSLGNAELSRLIYDNVKAALDPSN
jgi:hypothetical protein